MKQLSTEELQNLLVYLQPHIESFLEEIHTWKKWKNNVAKTSNRFFVEYFPGANLDFIWEKSIYVYNHFFSASPKKEDITFIPKESIGWGMKVYLDDNYLDLSFEKIEKNLRK